MSRVPAKNGSQKRKKKKRKERKKLVERELNGIRHVNP
jgi:hypothetical protein